MSLFKRTCLFVIGSLLATGAMAQSYEAGKHYTVIDPPVSTQAGPNQVELVEIFSYLCPHCQSFQPHIDNWLQHNRSPQLHFRRIHAQFNPSYTAFARTYVTADLLGVAEETHEPLFTAIHQERRQFRSQDDVAKFYSEFGIDKATFDGTLESFAVVTRLNKEQQDARRYGIRGTPSLVVNGKYLVGANDFVRSNDDILKIIKYLVDQEIANLPATDASVTTAEATAADAETSDTE